MEAVDYFAICLTFGLVVFQVVVLFATGAMLARSRRPSHDDILDDPRFPSSGFYDDPEFPSDGTFDELGYPSGAPLDTLGCPLDGSFDDPRSVSDGPSDNPTTPTNGLYDEPGSDSPNPYDISSSYLGPYDDPGSSSSQPQNVPRPSFGLCNDPRSTSEGLCNGPGALSGGFYTHLGSSRSPDNIPKSHSMAPWDVQGSSEEERISSTSDQQLVGSKKRKRSFERAVRSCTSPTMTSMLNQSLARSSTAGVRRAGDKNETQYKVGKKRRHARAKEKERIRSRRAECE